MKVTDEEIIKFIAEFSELNGYPPSIREISKGTGLRSNSTISSRLAKLKKNGLITIDPFRPRTVVVKRG